MALKVIQYIYIYIYPSTYLSIYFIIIITISYYVILTFCLTIWPLQAYIEKVKAEEMPKLELRLSESMNRLSFLASYEFSSMDIDMNKNTFQWHMRMPSIFDKHQEIVQEKTIQFQDFLKVKERMVFL